MGEELEKWQEIAGNLMEIVDLLSEEYSDYSDVDPWLM
jgi:hypothetical protein